MISKPENKKRVVVTGLGVVAPNAVGVAAFEQALSKATSGLRHDAQLESLGFGCCVSGTPQLREEHIAQYFTALQLRGLKASGLVYGVIAGKDAFKPGEAKNSWLTGTAAWNFYTISQYILGVRPSYNGLEIDPCIPKDWKSYKISRKFRGSTYHLEINNPHGVNNGVKHVTIDGKSFDGGNILPLLPAGEYNIQIELGK